MADELTLEVNGATAAVACRRTRRCYTLKNDLRLLGHASGAGSVSADAAPCSRRRGDSIVHHSDVEGVRASR